MNHIYRVIFNQETGTFQAVSEIVKTSRKSHSSKGGHLPKILLTPLSVAVTLLSSQAFASPTGGQVTAGVANIDQTGTITNINQSSQNAAINWQSFNVGKNETVNFNQPNAQSVTLNRVIGNERSVIDGAMNANGKVFISNANGLLIGKDAKINVGSLVATTANISDDDLMNGRYQFTGEGAGNIENLGHISVPKGGVVALVAPIVKNGGTITAHEGNALLASAESFSITLPDNANFAYTLDKGTLQGLVDNGGAILADAGRVVLTAKGVDTVKKSLIKHSGNIEANTVQNKNGVIELLGDLDNSALNVSGSLKAEGKGDDKGGFIETSSAQLNFDDSAVISTKSETGRTGTWLIDPKDFTVAPSGGDITGAKVSEGLQSNNVTLKSRDGAKEGKGDVIINDEINWDKNTLTLNAENDIHINKTMNGSGTAKLALEYGQGTSDGGESDYHIKNGARVNLSSGKTFTTKKGNGGEVLNFDVIHQMPNVHADGSTDDFDSQYVALGTNIDLSYIKSNNDFLGFGVSSEYGGAYLNVRQFDGLGHTLDNLSIQSNIDKIKNTQTIDISNLQTVSVLPKQQKQSQVYEKDGKVAIKLGGVHYTKLIINGDTIYVNNHEDDWDFGFFSFDSIPAQINLDKKLGEVYIDKNFINQSFTIVDTENKSEAGLFRYLENASVSNLNLNSVNINVTGQEFRGVGGLIGEGRNLSIKNTSVLGNIEGQRGVGGLVGYIDEDSDDNIITNSHFSGRIQGQEMTGGLIGSASQLSINNSHATGRITHFDNSRSQSHAFGGLVGFAENTIITNSFADGNVIADEDVGGLIGNAIHSKIISSYGTENQHIEAKVNEGGGLIGSAIGSNITNSYAMGRVSGGAWLGGLVGSLGHHYDSSSNNGQPTIIKNSLAFGQVDNKQNTGGLVGGDVGALYGQSNQLQVIDSYFDKNTTGQSSTYQDKGQAKTTEQLKQKSTFAGWDETIWDIQDGKLPTLKHATNPATTPTPTPPVTPPVVNVDFESAKKSLADTKLYRQNMLNRMVIFAKNGEFTKLNIDQINDNIRKEIAKTQALIDVLPDGAEKTNLQNQLNAITALTRDEIQNAEKISNDVAKEKQKEQQRKEQAEKDKKEAYEAVSNLEKSRQAILDNYYNQAKQGKLLDSSNINQTLSQAWLNAKNKVNKVTEQSEQTNLNNRLSVLGVLTQAEIDRAKAFVKAYQDNQARLEEEKKRAEEARRKAEEEKRKAEQQAKEQERIQALFKDAQNLVQQAKDFANSSQSLVNNGKTNDVATLNKNLTERKQQAQASIDKLPNNATKTLLQKQLNEIALVKANGGVNNPPNTNTPPNNTGTNNTPNIPKPIKPQEPKDKLELYKEQANVTKPQPEYRPDLIKKPEKPVELQRNQPTASEIGNLRTKFENDMKSKLNASYGSGIIGMDDKYNDHLLKGSILFGKENNLPNDYALNMMMDLLNTDKNSGGFADSYVNDIDKSLQIHGTNISIKEFVADIVEANILLQDVSQDDLQKMRDFNAKYSSKNYDKVESYLNEANRSMNKFKNFESDDTYGFGVVAQLKNLGYASRIAVNVFSPTRKVINASEKALKGFETRPLPSIEEGFQDLATGINTLTQDVPKFLGLTKKIIDGEELSQDDYLDLYNMAEQGVKILDNPKMKESKSAVMAIKSLERILKLYDAKNEIDAIPQNLLLDNDRSFINHAINLEFIRSSVDVAHQLSEMFLPKLSGDIGALKNIVDDAQSIYYNTPDRHNYEATHQKAKQTKQNLKDYKYYMAGAISETLRGAGQN